MHQLKVQMHLSGLCWSVLGHFYSLVQFPQILFGVHCRVCPDLCRPLTSRTQTVQAAALSQVLQSSLLKPAATDFLAPGCHSVEHYPLLCHSGHMHIALSSLHWFMLVALHSAYLNISFTPSCSFV